jgi:uncharacterized C2H2 Zn-finger protein
MMFDDIQTANRIAKERIERAEQDRLAREYRQYHRAYNPTLGWLGERMLAIGTQLKKRAGDKPDLN